MASDRCESRPNHIIGCISKSMPAILAQARRKSLNSGDPGATEHLGINIRHGRFSIENNDVDRDPPA